MTDIRVSFKETDEENVRDTIRYVLETTLRFLGEEQPEAWTAQAVEDLMAGGKVKFSGGEIGPLRNV